jgi:hypothetical protein
MSISFTAPGAFLLAIVGFAFPLLAFVAPSDEGDERGPQAEAPQGQPRPRMDPAAIPSRWFANTRDRTRGISNEERDAYYAILARAGTISLDRQRQLAESLRSQAETEFRSDPDHKGRKFSLFVDLIQHPERYRGKPVTLRGYIQGLETMEAGENDEGLTLLHQAYFFTADSLQNPYVVVTTEIPPDIPRPRKGSPTNDVSVTGYFFKIWSYEAERGNWAGPLILAGKLEWNPSPPPLTARLEFKIALGIGLALGITILALVILKQRRDDRRFRASQTDRHDSEADSLATLRRLEREE